MSDFQMQNYSSLWEEDYYQQQQAVGMSYESKNMWISDEKTSTNADTVNVRNHMSSPEAANPVITSPEKPKRRRNKASPSQPTTFLNASIKDFRALVQQHTGCHNTNSSPKGPITLCFGSPTSTHDQAYQLNHQYYA